MNAAKILFYVLVAVALAAVAIYLMGQFEVTRPLYDQVTGALGNAKDTVMGFLTNPLAAVGSATGAIGGIGGAIGIYNSMKGKLTESVNTANNTISQVTKEKEEISAKLSQQQSDAEKQVADLTEKLKAAEAAKVDTSGIQDELYKAQQALASSRNELSDVKGQYKTLQIKYEELQRLVAVK